MHKVQKYMYKSCSMQHIIHQYGSLKRKLVVPFERNNSKVSHVQNLVLYAIIWNYLMTCQFFLWTSNKICYALACWYTSFQIVVHKNWRKLTFIEFKIFTIWQTCKWCWFSKYSNIFLKLRAWNCISHCREYGLQHEPLSYLIALAFEMFVE